MSMQWQADRSRWTNRRQYVHCLSLNSSVVCSPEPAGSLDSRKAAAGGAASVQERRMASSSESGGGGRRRGPQSRGRRGRGAGRNPGQSRGQGESRRQPRHQRRRRAGEGRQPETLPLAAARRGLHLLLRHRPIPPPPPRHHRPRPPSWAQACRPGRPTAPSWPGRAPISLAPPEQGEGPTPHSAQRGGRMVTAGGGGGGAIMSSFMGASPSSPTAAAPAAARGRSLAKARAASEPNRRPPPHTHTLGSVLAMNRSLAVAWKSLELPGGRAGGDALAHVVGTRLGGADVSWRRRSGRVPPPQPLRVVRTTVRPHVRVCRQATRAPPSGPSP